MSGSYRPSHVAVDLDAISNNVRTLKICAQTVRFCAVVKANGYGHGAVQVARAALAGGADTLAVALVEEGAVLRAAGIEAPILLLSEPPVGSEHAVRALGLQVAVYSVATVARLAAGAVPGDEPLHVHLKVDTGMHRVGCTPADALGLALRIGSAEGLRLAGTFTHLAVADAPDLAETARQLDLFDTVLAELTAAGVDPGVIHAANSAGTIAHPRARYDMVRCGIAIYGQAPDLGLDPQAYGLELLPAIRVASAVGFVKTLAAGERASYGLRYAYEVDSVVASVPIGYADGIPRRMFAVGGEVLIGGRRCRIGGQVTMDQILVDCGRVDGPGGAIAIGDEVVLVGRQGDEEITAWELAERLGTIAYELTCGLGPRLPRRYLSTAGTAQARSESESASELGGARGT